MSCQSCEELDRNLSQAHDNLKTFSDKVAGLENRLILARVAWLAIRAHVEDWKVPNSVAMLTSVLGGDLK